MANRKSRLPSTTSAAEFGDRRIAEPSTAISCDFGSTFSSRWIFVTSLSVRGGFRM